MTITLSARSTAIGSLDDDDGGDDDDWFQRRWQRLLRFGRQGWCYMLAATQGAKLVVYTAMIATRSLKVVANGQF